MPSITIGQMDPFNDLGGNVIGKSLKPFNHPFHVMQLEQGFNGLDGTLIVITHRASGFGLTDILALDAGTVSQHDIQNVGRGGRGVNWAPVSRPHQAGEPANMIVVRMRYHDRIKAERVKRKVAVRAIRIQAVRIE